MRSSGTEKTPVWRDCCLGVTSENLHVLGGGGRFVADYKMLKTGKRRWFIE
jgi:hypothetical protein